MWFLSIYKGPKFQTLHVNSIWRRSMSICFFLWFSVFFRKYMQNSVFWIVANSYVLPAYNLAAVLRTQWLTNSHLTCIQICFSPVVLHGSQSHVKLYNTIYSFHCISDVEFNSKVDFLSTEVNKFIYEDFTLIRIIPWLSLLD